MHLTPLLDTHAWVWWLRGPAGGSQLTAPEAAALDALPPDQRPALCDISLWEVAVLVDLDHLQLDRLIVATACVHGLPLLSRDGKILATRVRRRPQLSN